MQPGQSLLEECLKRWLESATQFCAAVLHFRRNRIVLVATNDKLTRELDVIVDHPYGEPSTSQETAEVAMQFDDGTRFDAISVESITVPVDVANGKGGAITA